MVCHSLPLEEAKKQGEMPLHILGLIRGIQGLINFRAS